MSPNLPPTQFDTVSSIYGPGAILPWYLMALALSVSWMLHPKKRASGSIDKELVALMTLPAVAAVHMFIQSTSSEKSLTSGSNAKADLEHVQQLAAIEASLSTVESCRRLGIILFLIAVWMACFMRAIIIVSVGLFCFAAEFYVHSLVTRNPHWQAQIQPERSATEATIPDPRRLYMAYSTSMITVYTSILSVWVFVIVAMTVAALKNSWLFPASTSDTTLRNSEGLESDTSLKLCLKREAYKARARHASIWLSGFFIPSAVVLIAAPLVWESGRFNEINEINADGHTFPSKRLRGDMNRFVQSFLPQTSYEVRELDQAVALMIGLTTLVYSIASAVKERRTCRF